MRDTASRPTAVPTGGPAGHARLPTAPGGAHPGSRWGGPMAPEAGGGQVFGVPPGGGAHGQSDLPARDFYARHGFTADGGADGVTRWTRSLADGAVRRPPWVALVVADGA